MDNRNGQGLKSFFEKWNNPILFVQSENYYSIVAKANYLRKDRPFTRYKKYKDKSGVYVRLNSNRKVYESSWEYLN